jgi:glycyl-tRNA synthetase
VLRLHPSLAPYQVAVLPLSKNEQLVPISDKVAADLRTHHMTDVDLSGAIGRRYRRQDEVGTPYCVTIDFDTLEDNAVTVRDRDSMSQDRVSLDRLVDHLGERLPS